MLFVKCLWISILPLTATALFLGSANIDYILEFRFVIFNFLIREEIESGNRTKENQESRLKTLRRKKTNKEKHFIIP